MKILDILAQDEQEQKRLACEEQAEIDTESYHLGVWDGKLNNEPESPEQEEYWAGYVEGLRKYWLNQQAAKQEAEQVEPLYLNRITNVNRII